MSINDFTEGEIRKKIINKINPVIAKSRSPHQKGKIYLGGIVEARVKIPNDHDKVMKERKSKYIANALHLDHDEFNGLIDCPISGPKYYEILEKKVKKKVKKKAS
jgi:hypothetical protein